MMLPIDGRTRLAPMRFTSPSPWRAWPSRSDSTPAGRGTPQQGCDDARHGVREDVDRPEQPAEDGQSGIEKEREHDRQAENEGNFDDAEREQPQYAVVEVRVVNTVT